jgi:outer membrane protein assembly factor BamB/tetratricopeptide (TPR) repeat protein
MLLAASGLMLGCGLLFEAVYAQPKMPGKPLADGDMETVNVEAMALPTDREAKGIMTAAQEYIKKKDWDVVARSLQYLLEKPEDSFFELKRRKPDGKEYTARISIRIEANRLIGDLPPDGLEVYRQKFGARAKQMLEEGIEKNDPKILSLVAMRYRHTEAGVKAIHRLADYFLDRGNYQSACGQFQELIDLLDHEKPEVKKEVAPKVYFKAALAFKRLGNVKDAQTAERLWKQVEETVGEKGLTFNKQTFTLQQLRAEFDRSALSSTTVLAGYPVFRGDPSRTAQGIGGEPFLEKVWDVDMTEPRVPEKDVSRSPQWTAQAKLVADKLSSVISGIEKSGQKRAMLPGYFPIAARNRIIFRTYDGVYAYYIRDNPANKDEAGGELAWMQEADAALHSLYMSNAKVTVENWWGLNANNFGVVAPSASVVAFENAQVGALSHDNTYVYFVDDLAVPPPPYLMMQGMNGLGGIGDPKLTDHIYSNMLWAVDLESGLLKWQIGGRKLGGKPPLPEFGMGQGMPVPPGGAPIGPGGKPLPVEPARPPEPAKPFVPPALPQPTGLLNAHDELLDSFFLGPPLPLNGNIYTLVETAGEIQLVGINPNKMLKSKSTGMEAPELTWRQPLGTVANKLMLDPMRRMQPCHLAYSDGLMICPTNAGAVVAVNLYTQSLVWAHPYRSTTPQEAMSDPRFGGRRLRGGGIEMVQQVNLNQDRWQISAPAIASGRVVFTAPDSSHLTCLNLKDGELLWSVARGPKDLFMAGVFNGKVLVVGRDTCKALDLMDNGKVVWEQKIGMPSGQGVASNNVYYLPLKHGLNPEDLPEVCAINTDNGELHHFRSRKKEIPGNLLFYEGDVLSQSLWKISVFPQLRVKKAEMTARLEKNPKDPVGLTDRGELNLDEGDRIAAINDFKAALECQPPPDVRGKARAKLYEALKELFENAVLSEKNFTKVEGYLPLFKDVCLNEVLGEEKIKRQSDYLCLLGKGRESQGHLMEAFDAYMDFGKLNGNTALVPSVDERNTLAKPDVWARGRIAAMLEKAKPEERKPLEERIAAQWKEVHAKGELGEIRDFVNIFGSIFSVGRQARMELAERLLKTEREEDMREAQPHLLELLGNREDRVLAARSAEALAQLMVRKGLLGDAVAYYHKLGSDFADVPVRDGKTGAEIFNELITQKRFLPYLEPPRQNWSGKMRGEQVREPSNGLQTVSFTFEPEGELLPYFHSHRLVMDISRNGDNMWHFHIVDRITGEEAVSSQRLPVNPYAYNNNFNNGNPTPAGPLAQVKGHQLLLTSGTTVMAFDVAAGKLLWKYDLQGKGAAANPIMQTETEADGTQVIVYPEGYKLRLGRGSLLEANYVCLLTRDGLISFDPIKGPDAVLWKKEVPSGGYLFGDANYVFVVDRGESGAASNVRAVRASDGVTVKVPDFTHLFHPSRRLRTVGRNLLLFDDDPKGGKALRLYDVPTGKDVWRETFAIGSMPVRSHDPSLAGVVEPNGTVTIVDVNAQKTVLKTRGGALGAEYPVEINGLQDIQLVVDRERYYLILNKPPDPGVNVMSGFQNNGIRSTRVQGKVFAFDKATGELEWFLDNLKNDFLVLEQFEDLPILIFATWVNRFAGNGNERQTVKVEGYDKRTAKLITDSKWSFGPQFFFGLTVDPKAGVIELIRHDLKVRFSAETEAAGAGPGRGTPTGGGQPGTPNGPAAAPAGQGVGIQMRLVPQQNGRMRALPVAVPVQPAPAEAPEGPPVKKEKTAEQRAPKPADMLR